MSWNSSRCDQNIRTKLDKNQSSCWAFIEPIDKLNSENHFISTNTPQVLTLVLTYLTIPRKPWIYTFFPVGSLVGTLFHLYYRVFLYQLFFFSDPDTIKFLGLGVFFLILFYFSFYKTMMTKRFFVF